MTIIPCKAVVERKVLAIVVQNYAHRGDSDLDLEHKALLGHAIVGEVQVSVLFNVFRDHPELVCLRNP